MTFKFYMNESKLFDLMQLPRVLYMLDNEDAYGKDGNLLTMEKLDNKEHITMLNTAYKKMLPFEDEIHVFYGNEFMCSYDAFMLLTDVYSFFGYDDIEAYFADILSQSDVDIKKQIVYALLLADNDSEQPHDVLKKEAEMLIDKQAELMQYVKDLPTESNYKWNVLMLLENPRVMLQRYLTLLQQITPIFEAFYDEYKNEIFELEQRLTAELNEKPEEAFIDITQQMISTDVLEEENLMLISFFFPYAFTYKETRYGNFFVWGKNMEDGFKLVRQMRSDKIEQTVKTFKILGDKTRYEVLRLIATGITSTKAIAKKLDVTSATISYHINSFVTNGVVILSAANNRKFDINYDMLHQLWDDFIADLQKK